MITSWSAWQVKFLTVTMLLKKNKKNHDCITFVIWISEKRSESRLTTQVCEECLVLTDSKMIFEMDGQVGGGLIKDVTRFVKASLCCYQQVELIIVNHLQNNWNKYCADI